MSSPQTQPSGRAGTLRVLALVLGATIAFLISSELVLRGASRTGLLDLDGKGAGEVVASKGWGAHPELRWRMLPNSSGFEGVRFRTNSHGLRDQEIPLEKPTGTRRILALGDSTVFGFGVSFEKSFPERLETMLNERGGATRFDVINAGVPGYSIYQSLTYLRTEGLRFDPDMILLETNFNDRRYVPSADDVDGPLLFSRAHDALVRREWLSKSALSRITRRVLRGVGLLKAGTERYGPIDLDDLHCRVSPERYRALLAELIGVARERRLPVVLVPHADSPTKTWGFAEVEKLVLDGRIERALERLRSELVRSWSRTTSFYRIAAARRFNELLEASGRGRDRIRSLPAPPIRVTADGNLLVYLSDPYVDIMREAAEADDVSTVGLGAAIGGELYLDSIHLNRAGHALLAEALFRFLTESPPGPVSR